MEIKYITDQNPIKVLKNIEQCYCIIKPEIKNITNFTNNLTDMFFPHRISKFTVYLNITGPVLFITESSTFSIIYGDNTLCLINNSTFSGCDVKGYLNNFEDQNVKNTVKQNFCNILPYAFQSDMYDINFFCSLFRDKKSKQIVTKFLKEKINDGKIISSLFPETFAKLISEEEIFKLFRVKNQDILELPFDIHSTDFERFCRFVKKSTKKTHLNIKINL